MDYKNNSNTGLIIVADCMLLSVEYIGNVHLFFNTVPGRVPLLLELAQDPGSPTGGSSFDQRATEVL